MLWCLGQNLCAGKSRLFGAVFTNISRRPRARLADYTNQDLCTATKVPEYNAASFAAFAACLTNIAHMKGVLCC